MDYTPPFLEGTDDQDGRRIEDMENADLGREPTAPSRWTGGAEDDSSERSETLEQKIEGLYIRLKSDVDSLKMTVARATGSNRRLVRWPEDSGDQVVQPFGALDAQQLRVLTHALPSASDSDPKAILSRLSGSYFLTYLFEWGPELLHLTLRWRRNDGNARVERIRYLARQTLSRN
jgi:hypothetical protein